MSKNPSGFFASLRSYLLPGAQTEHSVITNNDILRELTDNFNSSCYTESVGSSLIFNMHFMVILHPETYEQRLPSFPVIVREAVKLFYKTLKAEKPKFEDLTPVSTHWQFRFGPGTDFNQERIGPNDIRVLGMLTGMKPIAINNERNTARVTMKVKSTNVFDKMDINIDLLRHIHFADNGNFMIKFNPDLTAGIPAPSVKQTVADYSGLARIDYLLGEKNRRDTYYMKDKEIVIARRDQDNLEYSNFLLLDSGFVSNPHARIRYNESAEGFQIASFSRNETRVNEKIVTRSEVQNPHWVDIPDNCQIMLNGMVTLNFKKS